MKHTGKGGRFGSSCKFASSKECTGDGARDVPPRAWCLGRLSFAPGATADVKNGATSSAKGRHARSWKKSGLTTKQQQNPTVWKHNYVVVIVMSHPALSRTLAQSPII
jgi:hypothetical protein